MIKKSTLCLFIIAAILSSHACVRMETQKLPESGEPYLRPPAQDLRDKNMNSVVVKADSTVEKIALHTNLMREVSEKSRQTVVSVYAQTSTPYTVSLLPIAIPGMGFKVDVPGQGLGSGFFIHPSGYILTNNHVIQRAQHIKVLTYGGKDYTVAIVARDPVYDLALLKVVKPDRKFPVLPMGDSNKIDAGDMVIAVGNPLGLGHTVTSGIISSTGRKLSGVSEEVAKQIRFIQTDTAINPGSSGGPLITMTGAWVGINTAGAVRSQGIGFSVPSSQVLEFLGEVLGGRGIQEPLPEK